MPAGSPCTHLSCLLVLAICVAPAAARADEPLFGYVFATDLLPQGSWEVAQWLTWREGKTTGKYSVVEGSSEFEYGFNDNLQIAGYLNYAWAEAQNDNVIDHTTLLPAAFASSAVGPHEYFRQTKLTGVSGEVIYRLLSPYLDPLGLAFYFKLAVGSGLRELNSRLILQKNFLDDRLVLAANLVAVQQTRFLHANPAAPPASDRARNHWEDGSAVQFGLGTSYRFISNWSAALEFVNEREWTGLSPFSSRRRTNDAYYFGPSLHYADEHFFGTLTFLDQLPWASDFANPEPNFVVGGRNYARNFERFRVRLKFGYYPGGNPDA